VPSIQHKTLGETQHFFFPNVYLGVSIRQLHHGFSAQKPHLFIVSQDMLGHPLLEKARPVLEKGDQVVRFDWKMPVGRLYKDLEAYTLYLLERLPLSLPIANVLKQRVAVNDVY
jgi:hypothetical protein